jgi:hypothetical protein
MLTPEEVATIRHRALLAGQLDPCDGQAATLAADVLLLLKELEAKDVMLGHLVHGSTAPLHGSPGETPTAGAGNPRR